MAGVGLGETPIPPSRLITAALSAALVAASAVSAPARAQELETPLREVEQMAELLGGVHYLRVTCVGRDDQSWRRMMVRLLDVEAPIEGRRRAALVQAFNDGYLAQERRYRSCDRSAREQESRLAAEGRRLAEALRDRYLN